MNDVDAGRHPAQIDFGLEQKVSEFFQKLAGVFVLDGFGLKPSQYGREADDCSAVRFSAKILITHRRNISPSNKECRVFCGSPAAI